VNVRGLLLDVEGVLVADKRYLPIAGAPAFLRAVRRRGVPLRLITNNTTDTRPQIIDKLHRAGFDFTIDELHTCIAAAVNRLRERNASRCLVLGSATLQGMFAEAGLTVVDDSDVDAVIVGLDKHLTYERLRLACDAVDRRRAAFIALHRNRLLADTDGRSAPSVGAIVAAIAYATRTEPIVSGKPSPEYFQQALDDIAVPPESVLVVSDDPFSDLAGAKRMGMQAALALSGKYTNPDVVKAIDPPERPDVIVKHIGDLLTEGTLVF
jgi:HAD superfamily hydrolase (TIGR01458 family)